jgi:succinoglycan biosynthesis transport protein ExoP
VLYNQRLAASLERLSTLEEDLNDLTRQLAVNEESPTIQAQQNAIARQYSVAFEQSELLAANPPVLGFTTLQTAQAVETTDRGLGAPTSRSSRALLGGLVGAALGVGIALVLGQLDRRLRTREQAESVLDMRARVMIPKVRDSDRDQLVVTTGRHDPLSDSYRTVRNVVGFVQGPAEPTNRARITLVVSPGPGDGKTSLAVNLAAAMAESGQRTILVNTDFRRPRLGDAIGAEATVPLPFMLEDLEKLDVKTLLNKTDRSGLLLLDLSTIEGSTGELVRATVEKIPSLTEIADSIVIDSSPVGATAEVLELIPHADVVVVIARVGHTQISAAQRAIAILRDLATVPMILVLGGVKMEKAQYYEYTDQKGGPTGRSNWWRRRATKNEPERELEPVE